jgi:hypothetical protein
MAIAEKSPDHPFPAHHTLLCYDGTVAGLVEAAMRAIAQPGGSTVRMHGRPCGRVGRDCTRWLVRVVMHRR